LEIGAWDLLFKTPNSKANLENSDLAKRTRFFRAKYIYSRIMPQSINFMKGDDYEF